MILYCKNQTVLFINCYNMILIMIRYGEQEKSDGDCT